MGSPTGANVVHPVGRAEAGVACRFSEAVSTAAHSLPNATAKLLKKNDIRKRMSIFFIITAKFGNPALLAFGFSGLAYIPSV